jgi:hypothetical protein
MKKLFTNAVIVEKDFLSPKVLKESLQNPVVQDRGMIKSRHETDYLCR